MIDYVNPKIANLYLKLGKWMIFLAHENPSRNTRVSMILLGSNIATYMPRNAKSIRGVMAAAKWMWLSTFMTWENPSFYRLRVSFWTICTVLFVYINQIMIDHIRQTYMFKKRSLDKLLRNRHDRYFFLKPFTAIILGTRTTSPDKSKWYWYLGSPFLLAQIQTTPRTLGP